MCGLVGYWSSRGSDALVAEKMATQLQHRGPDSAGVWLDKTVGLVMAHRRLSIIDLSFAGHQPMLSPCGRYVLSYNGEIYNHQDLRAELEKEGGTFEWRGHSDTETLLAALRHWGVECALQKLNGMFAFALWDKIENILFLARDRMGEKPLYYGLNGSTFLFGSELKALTKHPDWHGEIDRDALTLYLRHNCIPSPWSIYKGIKKIPPAHYVVIRECGRMVSEPKCYWDLRQIAEKGALDGGKTSAELIDELDELLLDSVKRRMMSDVPLGAFLSGGFDSSMVVAAMQAQSDRPIKTFSIGNHEKRFDEAIHAKAIAKHLGTDHTELYVTAQDAMDVIPKLPQIWDEPFSDSSQIPTYLVSQLARKDVVVSLSGDGGDELFAGYNRHVLGKALWDNMTMLPLSLRRGLGKGMDFVARLDLDGFRSYLPASLAVPNLADKISKVASALKAESGELFYKDLTSHWKNPQDLVVGGREPLTIIDRQDEMPKLSDLREKMIYLDMMSYLPDDILTKVDRASMAVCLEGRVPLLDHRLVEFSWQVPMEYKYRNGQGKWLLRQVLYRYVPKKLMERPKMGFGVPIEHWLRGSLREWAEELLDEKRLRDEGFFDPIPIRKMWQEHVTGKRRWHYYLWDVLMFQAWLEVTRI